jgi:hypothetical protein
VNQVLELLAADRLIRAVLASCRQAGLLSLAGREPWAMQDLVTSCSFGVWRGIASRS